MKTKLVVWVALAACLTLGAAAPEKPPFDGRPWNISTGNLSVYFSQCSPVGAYPRPNVIEPPPSMDQFRAWHNEGLVAMEDYVTWGAIERSPGVWDWRQHDAMEKAMHAAGMKYVAYCWVHFPPTWLRYTPDCTLNRCVEHGEATNYLSVFDPRTIQWFDHFYKALHDHFGDRIDNVYACIMGPYGEGNYPQLVPDWTDMGHCHEGYWCDDPYAHAALQQAMKAKYQTIAALNQAWGTHLDSFDEILPPQELNIEKFKPTPAAFASPQDKRRWLDFITWYHQAIIDFAEQSLKTVLKYYPAEKVRMKPGGNARGVNPISWGTYCPGYAKMAAPYHVELQPADSGGAVFGDKWMGTAYQFYGTILGTEPAAGMDRRTFLRRIFSDASCGASQFFTYEFDQHLDDIHKYVHLYTGHPGETQVAVFCPTTLYRLGGDVSPTVLACWPLRDFCDFDVLDELLIQDGALTTARYKALLVLQPTIIDQPILDKLAAFAKAGGKIIVAGSEPMQNVEGTVWTLPSLEHISPLKTPHRQWLTELMPKIAGITGVDGKLDGIWTLRRGKQIVLLNSTTKPVRTIVDGQTIEIPHDEIWENK
jgi:hypothetical protein